MLEKCVGKGCRKIREKMRERMREEESERKDDAKKKDDIIGADIGAQSVARENIVKQPAKPQKTMFKKFQLFTDKRPKPLFPKPS